MHGRHVGVGPQSRLISFERSHQIGDNMAGYVGDWFGRPKRRNGPDRVRKQAGAFALVGAQHLAHAGDGHLHLCGDIFLRGAVVVQQDDPGPTQVGRLWRAVVHEVQELCALFSS